MCKYLTLLMVERPIGVKKFRFNIEFVARNMGRGIMESLCANMQSTVVPITHAK